MKDTFFKKFQPNNIVDFDDNINNIVIYTRVSSKEQLTNDSLDNQYKTCTSYSIKNNFKIIEYFGGVYESAKSDDDRKEFQRMIQFVCNSNNNINGIVVYSHDRFSRTGLDGAFEVLGVLKRHNVKVYSALYNIDPDSIEGKVMLTMSLLQANVENESKSKLTKQRVKSKHEAGIWCFRPPRGYSRDTKKTIYINYEGNLIREAFQMLLIGYSMNEIQKIIAFKGLNIHAKRWHEVFTNPFYCGILISKSNNFSPIEGIHPKLISIDTFKKINSTNFCTKTVRANDDINNSKLPLKGYLKCECGCKFTGYNNKKKGRSYYKCNNPSCNKNLSAEQTNASFSEYMRNQIPIELNSIQLIDQLSEFFKELNLRFKL